MTITLNQKKVFDKVQKQVRNGENISISKAIRESKAYSPHVARQPSKVTRTKGWKELMDTLLPDSLLAKVHHEGLSATQVRFTPEGEQIRVEDYATREKYLKLGYEIKNKIKPDSGKNTVNVQFIVNDEQRKRIAGRIVARSESSQEPPSGLHDSDEQEL